MNAKIFKQSLLTIAVLFTISNAGFAQTVADTAKPAHNVQSLKDNNFQLKLDDLYVNLKIDLKDIEKSIAVTLNDITPQITLDLKGLDNGFNWGQNDEIEGKNVKEKVKSYGKSYPLDANDRIKLSNQYGNITVNTWDKHEVKVDVQIKASAADDDEAQRLLDGVRIDDSKEGDLVSFKTHIESNNGSWKIWNWGSNKVHKLEINYTVYMPAKTDLNVEQSYGSIVLPDLDGKVHIRSSYGSVSAQKLTNPANEIEGSYGSLKVGGMNGGHLSYSYGSVDMDECNNLTADLSYGSFKLGALTGAADLDLSYVGGFRINEIAGSLKKLNINSSYSGVSLGIPGNNNFDFDITVTYGGFNYNDDKVNITGKTPPDDSKHYSPTKNYKGHFGREGTGAVVNIRSTYGSVNFE